MLKQMTELDAAITQQVYPDLPCYVANEKEFIAAVAAGIASYETEPLHYHGDVVAHVRRMIKQA
jgi:hypothetical protein